MSQEQGCASVGAYVSGKHMLTRAHVVPTHACLCVHIAHACACMHLGSLMVTGRLVCHVLLKQEEDGPPRVKQFGDSFSTDQNSKMRIAGQLKEEAGPCKDHIFLVPKVRRPP